MSPHVQKQIVASLTADTLLAACSCADLKQIRAAVLEQLNRRYKWTRKPLYGSLDRGFTDDELDLFFDHCTNIRARTMFLLQRYLGLRIGEVVKIRLNDIDLTRRHLYIDTEKSRQPDCLYLHDPALDTITTWLRTQRHHLKGQPYLFPGKCNGHASTGKLAQHFRITIDKLDINRQYGHSLPCGQQGIRRSLRRLTTHSFRHHFIRHMWHRTKDQVLVMRLARHRKFTSTQVYLQLQQHHLDNALHNAYSSPRNTDIPTTAILDDNTCRIRTRLPHS